MISRLKWESAALPSGTKSYESLGEYSVIDIIPRKIVVQITKFRKHLKVASIILRKILTQMSVSFLTFAY